MINMSLASFEDIIKIFLNFEGAECLLMIAAADYDARKMKLK